jgi:enamine deaminase RidA (YjgF/YER057c/UK114 family)
MFMIPFIGVMTGLIALSISQDVYIYVMNSGNTTEEIWLRETRWIIEVNSEKSAYTWASASVIFVNAAILYVIALLGRSMAWGWLCLAVIFLLLSMDEALSFHERMSAVVDRHVSTGGIFHFSWVIPALVFCLVVGLAYIPFLLALPRRTMLLMAGSGAIFVSGAVGMEMVGSGFAETSGTYTMTYQMLANLEEALEGAGMLLFLYTLVDYLITERLVAPGAREPALGMAGATARALPAVTVVQR